MRARSCLRLMVRLALGPDESEKDEKKKRPGGEKKRQLLPESATSRRRFRHRHSFPLSGTRPFSDLDYSSSNFIG